MQFNDENFKSEVDDYQGLVLVDFFAPWCGPCKLMGPIIDELAEHYKDKEIKIGKYNVDEGQAVAGKFNIMGVPTLILFEDGKEIEHIVGMRSKEDLMLLIDKNL